MKKIVHNKSGYYTNVNGTRIAPHGTEVIDLPSGFEYNSNVVSVMEITKESTDEDINNIFAEIGFPVPGKPADVGDTSDSTTTPRVRRKKKQ